MIRKWQVVAVYQPLPRTVVRWERHGPVLEPVVPAGVGHEFKFTVVGAVDAADAIESVRRSGFFCGDIAKQFGFMAAEMFTAAA